LYAKKPKGPTNGINQTTAPKLQKLILNVKKPKGSDMDKLNHSRDQATHFANSVENLNVANFACNHKKASITYNTRPKICVSATNEGKTQIEFIAVRRKT
jgi:hypothetical protein